MKRNSLMPPPKTVRVAREDNARKAKSSAVRYAKHRGGNPFTADIPMFDTWLKKKCYVAYYGSNMGIVVFYEKEPLLPQHIFNGPGRLEPR